MGTVSRMQRHSERIEPDTTDTAVCVCGHGLAAHDTEHDICHVPGCVCGDDLDGFEPIDLDIDLDIDLRGSR
jgi:hypothetical protein